MVICLKRGANGLYMVQLVPMPPRITSYFNKIQIALTFLVPVYLGRPGKEADKRVSRTS